MTSSMSGNGVAGSASFAHVYWARMPELPAGRVASPARQAEIDACGCERVRREKYFVWQLLSHALRESCGLSAEALSFSKSENGKWQAAGCEFSLSHSQGILAVAVSQDPVGVDVECVAEQREGLASRILTEAERDIFESLSEEDGARYLTQRWAAKEAHFKRSGKGVFRPREIAPAAEDTALGTVFLDGHSFVWAVATERPQTVRVFGNILLENEEQEGTNGRTSK